MKRVPISKGLRFDVLNRDGFKCKYCGITAEFSALHVDHKVPVALGGSNDIDNLVTACVACNLGKRTKLANLTQELNYDGVPCPFADGWPNDIEEPVLYINKTWAVTWFGMERLDRFYAIIANDLGDAQPHDPKASMWLEDLCAKKWVYRDIEQTISAFLRAVEAHRINIKFDMQYSLTLARDRANESLSYERLLARHFPANSLIGEFDMDDEAAA